MKAEAFKTSLSSPAPPEGVSGALEALWHQAKGDWQRAHKLAQTQNNLDGYWVHAYLHRVEGDTGNAAYWYRRAGKDAAGGAFDDEWLKIVGDLLTRA